ANPKGCFERLICSSMAKITNSKLAQLRAKTDQDLVTVIGRRLDAGLNFARNSRLFQAEEAHKEALRLLPWVSAPDEELQRLEAKLERLGNLMERYAVRAA